MPQKWGWQMPGWHIYYHRMWNSRPPPPLHGENHLKFPFWLFEPFPKKLAISVNNYQSYYVKCSIFMVMKLDHNKIRFHKSDGDKSFKSIHLGQYKICVVWHCALIYIHSISHLNQSRYVSNSSYDKMCTLSLPHTGVSKYVVFKRSTKILS